MIQKDDYITMLVVTLVICILLCYRRKGGLQFIERFSPNEYSYVDMDSVQSEDSMPKYFEGVLKDVKKRQPKVSVPVSVQNDPSLLYNNVSAYDGLCLKTGNPEFWSHSPNNVPLVKDNTLFSVQGHGIPTKPVLSDPSSLSGAHLDGTPDTPNKMFMFANNQSSPACCPSTFSTDTGCVCTTDKQRDFIAARGYNNL